MNGCSSKKILFIAALCATAAGILFSLFFLDYSTSPAGTGTTEVVMEISPGSSFSRVAQSLENRGVISHRYMFHLLAAMKGAVTSVQAGEYAFAASVTPLEVLERLVKGRVREYRIVIPEGFTVRQIAARLASRHLVDERRFNELAFSRKFCVTLGIHGESAEGYLFPDTYLFTRSMKEEEMIRCMVKLFRERLPLRTGAEARRLGCSLAEIITIASIIEKEGGEQAEWPLTSAVLHNRLKKRMKLQSDPTVIYAIRNFDGNLTEEHLKIQSPYNTYVIQGLPPGPICNPGIRSIEAALHPAPVEYLYFVSNNSGGHVFSSTLTEHSRAVARYLLKKKTNQ
ncbi:MAG: endolytic transglycosylase MltG [Deltaproteobacteria bacterium]|nr:endolytic transglycosylase MltG [Deltaproteobacteria bacterium]